jgi:hypothetical protein
MEQGWSTASAGPGPLEAEATHECYAPRRVPRWDGGASHLRSRHPEAGRQQRAASKLSPHFHFRGFACCNPTRPLRVDGIMGPITAGERR